MADVLTYNDLLERGKEIDELLQSPSLDEEEKKELKYIWNSLKSREESKFDSIINVIKDCDKQITSREKEIAELKKNQEFWKNKRKTIINIIKTEKNKFSLYKTTMIQRLFNGSTIDWKEEMLPDKEQLRKVLSEDSTTAPANSKLIKRFSLTYNLRKRLKTGI